MKAELRQRQSLTGRATRNSFFPVSLKYVDIFFLQYSIERIESVCWIWLFYHLRSFDHSYLCFLLFLMIISLIFFCLRDEMVWQREQGKILWRSRRGWRYRQLLSGPWQSTGRDKARTNDEQHHKYSRLHNVSIEIIAWSENRNETIRIVVKFVFVLEL